MRRRGRSRRANAGLPHPQDGACAREARPHGWSGSGRSGKAAENHAKPATLLSLTWSDSGGRGGSEDYGAPESHAAARPPSPRKLQLPACPGRQPALLPDPEGTPLPFPPTPTPAQPQSPPSPQRRSGQLRHGAAPPRCRSVRPTRTPPSSSGLSPGPAGRLRSPATGPGAPSPTVSPQGPPPASAQAAPTSPGPPPPGTFAVRGAPGPAHLLPRGSRSPASAPLRSAPPWAPTGPAAAPPRQPPLSREGPSPSASLPAAGAPPAPARSWSPAGTGGARPDPPSASPLPLGSLTAPRPVQRERKRSPEGKGTEGRTVFIQSCERVRSGARGPPDAPPAPGTPQQSVPEPRSSVRRGMHSWLAGSWSDGLLGRGEDCQKRGAGH
ncbi:basic proline-rich protein-like [Aquila chrysaetos chrysaetos]|uniref:basic proline-rich protein-like n=1 Tax=Aquila chrysaetos chrysaetos TaxID=223781 RepID=UPI001B7D40E9|nr:basic proline-rich protein-like [Aquila chrysaetos chrysaetos]